MFDRDAWVLNSDFSTLSLDKWQQSIDLLASFFKATGCSIAQHTPSGYRIAVSHSVSEPFHQQGLLIPNESKSFIDLVNSYQKAVYVPNTEENIECEACIEITDGKVHSYLGVPIFWSNGHLFGVLSIIDDHVTEYKKPFLDLVQNIRQHIETDLQLMLAEEELSQLCITDEMTGIYNRTGFNSLAKYKLTVAKRYGHNFGLMYFDLDNLGLINEQLGWEMGDRVVQTLADALYSELRESDIAARLGEDNFAALVFIREHDDLENLATRIQRKLNLLKGTSDQLPPITTSVGARWYEADKDLNIGETLNDVDRLMFAIKLEKKQSNTASAGLKH